LEKNAGPFALIPDFQKFKSNLETEQHISPEKNLSVYDELSEAKLRGFYDDNIVFSFYSNSFNKPLPGKGSGEKIPNDKLKDFVELANIPDWRKKLDNSWVQEFTLDNHKWASVEHYCQACKFKENHPAFYAKFSLDSGTDISKDPEMAKHAATKNGIHNDILLRPENIFIDPTYPSRLNNIVYNAQFAKINQNPDLKNLLLHTKDALLVHYKKGKKPIIMKDLMTIRNNMNNNAYIYA
jgi:predicted NAD-dependent protein-ADP-ribosyltransferase YbiA (DUF1768 family)